MFQISSESESDPQVVSDYLEYFKNISDELLQYIINITDTTVSDKKYVNKLKIYI